MLQHPDQHILLARQSVIALLPLKRWLSVTCRNRRSIIDSLVAAGARNGTGSIFMAALPTVRRSLTLAAATTDHRMSREAPPPQRRASSCRL